MYTEPHCCFCSYFQVPCHKTQLSKTFVEPIAFSLWQIPGPAMIQQCPHIPRHLLSPLSLPVVTETITTRLTSLPPSKWLWVCRSHMKALICDREHESLLSHREHLNASGFANVDLIHNSLRCVVVHGWGVQQLLASLV